MPKKEYLEENLWRCDCMNAGTDVDISYHGSLCSYVLWYNEMYQEDNEEDEE